MIYDIQLNVRVTGDMLEALQKAAAEVGTTPSQIAREAIIKELKRRKGGCDAGVH